MNNNYFPGSISDVTQKLKISRDGLNKEIDFVEKILQEFYTANPEIPVLCHNDLHGGNIMINKSWFHSLL